MRRANILVIGNSAPETDFNIRPFHGVGDDSPRACDGILMADLLMADLLVEDLLMAALGLRLVRAVLAFFKAKSSRSAWPIMPSQDSDMSRHICFSSAFFVLLCCRPFAGTPPRWLGTHWPCS
jgi:hypothetical protein